MFPSQEEWWVSQHWARRSVTKPWEGGRAMSQREPSRHLFWNLTDLCPTAWAVPVSAPEVKAFSRTLSSPCPVMAAWLSGGPGSFPLLPASAHRASVDSVCSQSAWTEPSVQARSHSQNSLCLLCHHHLPAGRPTLERAERKGMKKPNNFCPCHRPLRKGRKPKAANGKLLGVSMQGALQETASELSPSPPSFGELDAVMHSVLVPQQARSDGNTLVS